MLEKFKIAFYALIVGLVLVLPSLAHSDEDATSCKGWNCNIEGQICPQGVPGASGGDFICTNSKWVEMAKSCKGWNCSIEGQICPKDVPGASAGDFICTNSKWVQIRRHGKQWPGRDPTCTGEYRHLNADVCEMLNTRYNERKSHWYKSHWYRQSPLNLHGP